MRSSRLRSWGVVFFQLWNAVSAAFDRAIDVLGGRRRARLAMTWPFAGFSMSSVSPLADSTDLAPDELLVRLDAGRSMTSVTESLLQGARAGLAPDFEGTAPSRRAKSQGAGTILAHRVVSDQPHRSRWRPSLATRCPAPPA